MARPLRIEFPGALYHVMSRGNDRQPIVRDDADRQRRLDWLRRTVETYGWRLHAFVLMGNHDHLFVATPEGNLCVGMQYLNGSYTSYFNRRHRRAGHLFQGRFRGQLIEEEGYFLEVSRYIHLNPVRAGLVERPEQWPWSSYAGYQQERRALDWVSYAAVLGEFGQGDAARRRYARFVHAGLSEPPGSPFAKAIGGVLLGSANFVERVRKLIDERPPDTDVPQLKTLRRRPPLSEIVAVVTTHFGCDPTLWTTGRRSDDASRAVAAYLARRRFGYPAGEVAQTLGYRSHGSVRNALARVEAGDRQLHDVVTQLDAKLR
jgi:putative transposase